MLDTTKHSMATVAALLNSSISIDVSHWAGALSRYSPFVALRSEAVLSCAAHCITAKLCQRFRRLSVPPNRVVKLVESSNTICPARCWSGDIQSRQLNSVLPALVKGCGRSRSIGWRASKCTDAESLDVNS